MNKIHPDLKTIQKYKCVKCPEKAIGFYNKKLFCKFHLKELKRIFILKEREQRRNAKC